jgi:predicted NBD/HSP70 family sugar kinase
VCGLKHQKEKRSMDHFAGLDVSVKKTSVCIVDDTGRIVREVKVASERHQHCNGGQSESA